MNIFFVVNIKTTSIYNILSDGGYSSYPTAGYSGGLGGGYGPEPGFGSLGGAVPYGNTGGFGGMGGLGGLGGGMGGLGGGMGALGGGFGALGGGRPPKIRVIFMPQGGASAG